MKIRVVCEMEFNIKKLDKNNYQVLRKTTTTPSYYGWGPSRKIAIDSVKNLYRNSFKGKKVVSMKVIK